MGSTPDKEPVPQSSEAEETSVKRTIPLVSIPHDADLLAQEMAELFEEDKVTHKHGSSEPEAD